MERACRPLCGRKLGAAPEKTKIVYCKDANRRDDFPSNQSFDFLGFKSEQGSAGTRGHPFACFLPAASPKALNSHQPDDPAMDSSSSQ